LNPESANEKSFVDREAPLSDLFGRFNQVVDTGSGRAVFISGEPGIGKTALVEKFVAKLPPESANILRTKGREFAASPFVALAGLFEDASVLQPARYGKQMALTVLNVARLIPAFGTYASAISDAAKDLQGLSEVDSRIISNSLYVNNLFTSLLEKIAKRKPVVMILDDIQWFDSSSLEVLGFAAGKLANLRILVISCFRKGHVTSEREEQNMEILDAIVRSLSPDVTSVLNLVPLDKNDSGKLAEELLKRRKDARSTEILVKRGDGNPLYMTKLAREYFSSPQLARGGDANLETAIPLTFLDAISRQLQRINKHDPEGRLALDYAAVLGREFSIPELAALAKSDPLRLKHTLETLESVYGIVGVSGAPEAYEFDHEMTREAIERRLGSLAQKLHLEAAEYYESHGTTDHELLAHHYESGHAYERAMVQYRKAAEKSSKTYSFADSARYLEKCLSFIDGGKVTMARRTRRELVFALAEAQFSSGQFAKALENALAVIKPASPSDSLLADALLLAGRCTRYLGVTSLGMEGVGHLKKAAAIYEAKGDAKGQAATYSALSTVLDHYNFHDEAVSYFGKCRKALNQTRDRTGLAILQRKSGMVYDSRIAIPYIRNALSVFERSGSKIEAARCLNNLGAEMLYTGDFGSAESNLLRAVESYRKIDSYEIDAPLNNLGLVYMAEGRMEDSTAVLTEAEARASEDFDRICAGSNLATVERLTGRIPEALERLLALRPLVENSGEPLIQDYFAFNVAATVFRSGKAEEALGWLERYPLNSWKGDSNLAEAKRLKLKGAILDSLGKHEIAQNCIKRAREALNTRRPQKWFYELDYYPCDIHILD